MTSKWMAAALLAAGTALAADVQVVDQVIARINGDIISQDELKQFQQEKLEIMRQEGANPKQLQQASEEEKKNALRDRIDELLLTQKAKELNINVDAEVTKYMTNVQRQIGVADPEKFHEMVKQQSGMNFEDFVAKTRDEYMTRQVIGQEVGRKIVISDKEISDYYNAHKQDFVREEKVYLSEILISTEGKDAKAADAAKKKADQVALEASRGQRFSDLARDNSDAVTAKQGGELGSYKKGDLAKDIEDAVWNLPKGGITKPIRVATGYEVFRVDDHTKAGLEPLDEARAEIENILYPPKMQPRVREYLTDLRKSAFIQIKSGYVDSGAAPGMNTAWQDVAVLKPEMVNKAEVEQKTRHKRLLWLVPVPWTHETVEGTSSSK